MAEVGHLVCRKEEAIRVRRLGPRPAGRILVRAVAVPDEGIVRPDIRRVVGVGGGGAPAQGDFRILHERGHLDPDERFAVRVPRVDIISEAVAVGVLETEVGVVVLHEVAVGEAGRRRSRDSDEERKVRERGVVGDARHSDRGILGVVGSKDGTDREKRGGEDDGGGGAVSHASLRWMDGGCCNVGQSAACCCRITGSAA